MKKIGLIVGSLRKESFNKKVAKIVQNLAASGASNNSFESIEIGHLPFYNEDLEADLPKEYADFRKEIKDFDAFIFLSPEYNRSIPAVLKNALDVGSRPYGKSSWNEKPVAVISVSLGALGGFGANHHLRQCFTFLNMPVLQQPEMYIGPIASMLNEKDELKDPDTINFFESFIKAFDNWIDKF